MSIDEVIDKYLNKEGSLQARQLGYHPRRGIDETMKNLESLDFIGLSERFDESLDLCNKTFGWSLKAIIYNRGKVLFEERCAKHGI